MAKLKKTKIDNGLSVDSGGAIVGGKNVSLEGHRHNANDITDFNTSVRNAINSNVGALGNAALLDGHKADEFALKDNIPETQLVWNNIRIDYNGKDRTEMVRVRLPIGIMELNNTPYQICYSIIANTTHYTYILETNGFNVVRFDIIPHYKSSVNNKHARSLTDMFKIAFISQAGAEFGSHVISDNYVNTKISYLYFNIGEVNTEDIDSRDAYHAPNNEALFFNIQSIKCNINNSVFDKKYSPKNKVYDIGKRRIQEDSGFIKSEAIGITPRVQDKEDMTPDESDKDKIKGKVFSYYDIPFINTVYDMSMSGSGVKYNFFNPTGNNSTIKLKDYIYTIGYNKKVSIFNPKGNYPIYLIIPFMDTDEDFLIKITPINIDGTPSNKELYLWKTNTNYYLYTNDILINSINTSYKFTLLNNYYRSGIIIAPNDNTGNVGHKIGLFEENKNVAFYEIVHIYKMTNYSKYSSSGFSNFSLDNLDYNNITVTNENTFNNDMPVLTGSFSNKISQTITKVSDFSTVNKELLNVFNSLYSNEAPSPSLKINNTTVTFGGDSDNIIKAPALQTPRKINGVDFDGTKDITITATSSGGNADTLGGVAASNYVKQTQVGNAAGKIPVFTSDGKLQYPDGHLEWIE